ncbi:MAG: hypothetical protein OHK0046_40110 [Anaerolineae bacterium]
MNTSPNPFTPMLLTYDPANFYGRENEIITILQVITAIDTAGHALHGARSIGKTTLLKYLKDPDGALVQYEGYIRPDYLPGGRSRLFFVYLSLHAFEDGDSLFFIMLRQIKFDLHDDDELQVPIEDFDETFAPERLTKILRKTIQNLKSQHVRVVFLLDDFDEPIKYLNEDDDHLLRHLSDDAVIIIATEHPISEINPKFTHSSPFLGILRPEIIGLLSEDAAQQLIIEPAQQNGVQFTPHEVGFLLETAGRQPFILIAACELYFNMRKQYPDIARLVGDPQECENIQRQFIVRLTGRPHIKDALDRMWMFLKPEEQDLLVEIAYHPKITFIPFDPRSHMASQLENRALVYSDILNNAYQIFSILFMDYIQQLSPRVSNGIGGDNLLDVIDDLSPIDQAVARYLYERPNQVCTFEELLDTIWKDRGAKRALEAAVHRLRQKVKDNPHEEIKNIRGTGYMFATKEVVT